MMMRLLSNSICLGLLTTLTGAIALVQPAKAAQEQTASFQTFETTQSLLSASTGLPGNTDAIDVLEADTPALLTQASDDLPSDLLDANTLPVEEDPGEADGFIDETIIRQVPSSLPPLIQDELGDELTLEIFPVGDSFLPADGRSTLKLRGSILDASDRSVNKDVVVTLTTSAGTFIGADYDIDRSGFQILARQGEFEVELRSSLDAQTVTVRASVPAREALGLVGDEATAQRPVAELDGYTQLNFTTPYRPSLVAGVVDFRFGPGATDFWGRYADFLDPGDIGDYEADLDAGIFATGTIGDWLLTAAFNSERALNERCNDNRLYRDVQNCEQTYPTYGDNSTTDFLTPSIDSFYVRFQQDSQIVGYEPNFFMWGDYNTEEFSRFSQEFSALNRQLHGFKGNYTFANGLQLTALYANDLRALQRDTIVPDGTSGYYFLSRRLILAGSEDLFFEIEELNRPGTVIERVRLSRGVDYSIDYDRGSVLFNSPVSAVDANPFGPALIRRIVATYQVDGDEAEGNLFGGRLQYNFDTSLESPSWVGASAIFEDQGAQDFSLLGLDALIPLGNNAQLVAEVARSELDNPLVDEEGVAVRLEATGQITPDLGGTAYFRNAESGFRNSATTSFRPGQTRWGGQLGYNVSRNTQLQFQFDREENDGNEDLIPTTLDELINPGLTRPTGAVVNNSLTTVRAGIQQQFGALTGNLDWVYRDRNDRVTGNDVESNLISAGLTWPLAEKVSLRAQTDIAIGDEDEAYPGQTVVGVDWAVLPEVTLRFAQRFFHDDDITPDALTTVDALVNYDLTDNTHLTGRYSVLGANSGMSGQGALGLNHRINLSPGLHVDLGYQRIFGDSLSSITGGNQFAQPYAVGQSAASLGLISGSTYTVGLEYTDNSDFQASARFEHRDSDGEDNTVITASAAGKLSPALTTLLRLEHANFGNFTNDTVSNRLNSSTSARLGLAYRNPYSDKFNGLLSYEYAINPSSTPNSLLVGAGSDSIQEHTLAMEGIYAPSWRWEFYGKYALRATNADLDSLGVSSTNAIHLGQFRATHRFAYRWDVTGEVRYITQPETNYDEVGFALEAGYYMTPELRLGLGYSFGSVNDRSLGGSGYRSDDGPYIGITFKVNELWDQFGLQQVAPSQQEESLVETDSSPPPESVSSNPVSSQTTNGGEE
ncbi:TonB-dependent receptor [Leptothoe spongobia]|uniref:TonB-dependent receptor n=1 Tax=Leptothoe spongobia TAU-MAC 1115 TaxID=1967444 RepID=A0A947GHC1_9CYAN|nr:TonB-dependent receptor [Leptothoe spongobia]MBT9314623.1 TonB-dependent receptor [Leptothoe spongobia TAU-MAC 1115]